MPVLPDFSSFAQTPNLGGDYLQGVQVAQSAIQHAQELQLQRETLAQHARQAEIEYAGKQADFQQNQMRYEHQMAIDKAYKDATIGLHTKQLEQQQQAATAAAALHLSQLEQTRARDAANAAWHTGQVDVGQQNVDLRTKAATDKAALQQQYQNRSAAYQEPDYQAEMGEEPMSQEDAARRATIELGPQMGSAFNTAIKPGAATRDKMPQAWDRDPSKQYITAGGAYIPPLKDKPSALEATPIAGMSPDVAVSIGGKVFKKADPTKEVLSQLNPLVKVHENDVPGQQALLRKEAGKKLSDAENGFAKVYEEREKEIKRLRGVLDKIRERVAAPTTSITNSIAPYIPSNVQTNSTTKFRWDPQNGLQPK